MRFSLHRVAAILGCMAIICFCSCERHHVGELPPEPSLERAHEVPTGLDATPAPRGTPADFFPPTPKP